MPHVPSGEKLPHHVAIIMDGNGRWAKARGLQRLDGHRKGAEVVRDITTHAREVGIRFLTLYSFSKQNWQRPRTEVAGLMSLLKEFCQNERRTLLDNGIRLRTIGNVENLPLLTRGALKALTRETRKASAMTLTLALDYGAREELVRATRTIARQVADGSLQQDSINEQTVTDALWTADMPDPDLVIRTSGERRVSNFLLWQIAYAELFFTDRAWPEFDRDLFNKALCDFAGRTRRFGATDEQLHGDGGGLC